MGQNYRYLKGHFIKLYFFFFIKVLRARDNLTKIIYGARIKLKLLFFLLFLRCFQKENNYFSTKNEHN